MVIHCIWVVGQNKVKGYTPYGTFCIIFNGEYLSYYFQNEKGLTELLATKGIDLSKKI